MPSAYRPFSFCLIEPSGKNLACSAFTLDSFLVAKPDVPPYLLRRVVSISSTPRTSPPRPIEYIVAASKLRKITYCSSAVDAKNLTVRASAISRGSNRRARAVKLFAVSIALRPVRTSAPAGEREII